MNSRIDQMEMYYILEGKELVKTNCLERAKWFEKNSGEKFLKQTNIGNIKVSTIFLGLVDNIFETMVFTDFEEGEGEVFNRYKTYDDAMAGHKLACERVSFFISQNEVSLSDMLYDNI